MKGTTLRQGLILFSTALCSVSDGMIFGQMSGMIDALRSNDSSIQLNDDEISWIASVINITCFIGFLLAVIITETYGRKNTMTILTMPVIGCWLMVYFAQDKVTLLLSRVIIGISYGGITLLIFIIIGEYVSPSMRPLCLNLIFSLGILVGTMLGHVLSIFLHWRTVALIGIIPAVISAILPLFWVESPSWLATKGRFEECNTAFKKLHTLNHASNNELKVLIETWKKKCGQCSDNDSSLYLVVRKFISATKKKAFWRITILLAVIVTYRVMAGRILFSTYAMTMLQDITGSANILFFTLLVDGFTLIGCTLSCFFVSMFKMRSLLFILGTIANVFQILFAASLYLWPENNIYIVWTKITLLALYFISVSTGPYVVVETLISEILPLEIKTVLLFFMGIINGVIQFADIKIAPYFFLVIGYHGVFFFHSVIIFLCFIYFYIAMPETKGRTLQEIEYYFNHKTFDVKENIRLEQDVVLLKK